MAGKRPPLLQRIITLLSDMRKHGGIQGEKGRTRLCLSVSEMADRLHVPESYVRKVIKEHRDALPACRRSLYIAGYERPIGKAKHGLPKARYGLGNYQDAKYPVNDEKVTSARYRDKYPEVLRIRRIVKARKEERNEL